MDFIEHPEKNGKIVEVVSDDIIIQDEQDVLDLMANIDYLYEARKIVLRKHHLCDDFFILRTGIAGGIMQKFSNYRVRAAIVGEFDVKSKSLKAFIAECNRTKQVLFTNDLATALEELA